MPKTNWSEQFDELVESNDSRTSFFPFGGDSYDFDSENCKDFIKSLISEVLDEVKIVRLEGNFLIHPDTLLAKLNEIRKKYK